MSPTNDRIRSWWTDDPHDPARPAPDHSDVQDLLARIAPGEPVAELGGTMSLNLHLQTSHRVLRVHQPFVTAGRLEAEQEVRRQLACSGVVTAVPIAVDGKTVLRCGIRLAEFEPFIEHTRPEPSVESYQWLFSQLSDIHLRLADLDITAPRSLAATWSPPGSLNRWLDVTIPALSKTDEGAMLARRLKPLVNRIRKSWVPPHLLPTQLVHGDFRLGNVVLSPAGRLVVFDFGFMDRRPRLHDLAYSASFMVLALGIHNVAPGTVVEAMEAYGDRLLPDEARALPAYAASVMLHAVAHDGFTADPLGPLERRTPFVDVAAWFLDHGPELGRSIHGSSIHPNTPSREIPRSSE